MRLLRQQVIVLMTVGVLDGCRSECELQLAVDSGSCGQNRSPSLTTSGQLIRVSQPAKSPIRSQPAMNCCTWLRRAFLFGAMSGATGVVVCFGDVVVVRETQIAPRKISEPLPSPTGGRSLTVGCN